MKNAEAGEGTIKASFESAKLFAWIQNEQEKDTYVVSLMVIFGSVQDEKVKALLLGHMQMAGKMGIACTDSAINVFRRENPWNS